MLDPTQLNQIQRAMYDSMVKKLNSATFNTSIGTITNVDEDTWTASVEIMDPVSHQSVFKDGVPLPHTVNGLKPVIPAAGDKVAISFIGGNIHVPYITNIYPSYDMPMRSRIYYGVETSRTLGIF
jgi:hypothetical protein